MLGCFAEIMHVRTGWKWTERRGFSWSYWRLWVEEWTTSCTVLSWWKSTVWFFLSDNYLLCIHNV